jgi:hypothetical protein
VASPTHMKRWAEREYQNRTLSLSDLVLSCSSLSFSSSVRSAVTCGAAQTAKDKDAMKNRDHSVASATCVQRFSLPSCMDRVASDEAAAEGRQPITSWASVRRQRR